MLLLHASPWNTPTRDLRLVAHDPGARPPGIPFAIFAGLSLNLWEVFEKAFAA